MHEGKKDKQVKQHYYAISSQKFIQMKVYNMTIQARDVVLNSAHAIVDHTLVVCYHAHCSIAYVGSFLIRMVL